MNSASAREIRKELQYKSSVELVEICMRISRFKKENKELLTYLLFESENEDLYTETIKKFIDTEFSELKDTSPYRFKKAIRKILRISKRYVRYSRNKETEVAVLLHFCKKLKEKKPSLNKQKALLGTYKKQMEIAEKAIEKLHEDLQYDYKFVLDNLKIN